MPYYNIHKFINNIYIFKYHLTFNREKAVTKEKDKTKNYESTVFKNEKQNQQTTYLRMKIIDIID